MPCRRCQARNDAGARFCEECGARRKQTGACGAQAVGAGKVCRSWNAARTQETTSRIASPQHLVWRVQLFIVAAIVAFTIIGLRGSVAEEREKWIRHLEQAESEARRGDVASALAAVEQAYGAALETGRWESVIEYADAALGLRDRPGLRRSIIAKAREAYFIALRRARDSGSTEGMLRAAEGFARLGDFEAVAYAARLIQLAEARETQSP